MRPLLILLALASAAVAEPAFQPPRGFSTDLWTHWMALSDRMADPDFAYPDYPDTFTPRTLPDLAAHGFDTMRLAADPGPLLALRGAARARRIADLVAQVKTAQAAGLKVILDLHAYPAKGEPQDTETLLGQGWQGYLQLVEEVGRALSDLPPARTAFEPLNEPVLDCEAIAEGRPQRWPAMLERLHATARMAAPRLTLILSGACWGGAWGLAALQPLEDDNVLWSFHSYEPFEFSHQGANWAGSELAFVQGLAFPPGATPPTSELVAAARDRAAHPSEWTADLASLASPERLGALIEAYRSTPEEAATAPLRQALTWAQSHGLPASQLMLGEFGALWQADDGTELDPASHARFLHAKVAAAEAMGIGWVAWSFSGAMGLTREVAGAGPQLDGRVCRALGLEGC